MGPFFEGRFGGIAQSVKGGGEVESLGAGLLHGDLQHTEQAAQAWIDAELADQRLNFRQVVGEVSCALSSAWNKLEMPSTSTPRTASTAKAPAAHFHHSGNWEKSNSVVVVGILHPHSGQNCAS